jgi:hypothetical protein
VNSQKGCSKKVQYLGVGALLILMSSLVLVSIQYQTALVTTEAASSPTFTVQQGNKTINIYILNISTSGNSAVWDRNNVTRGVRDAVGDAVNNTELKVTGETFRVTIVNSSDQLLDMVNNGANYTNSVFINAHGEVLPIPDTYYNDSLTWIDKIADNCRNHGWIWAQIAGYPFYYIGNTHYWETPQTIGPKGLQRFLGDNTTSASTLNETLREWGLTEDNVNVGFNTPAFGDIYSRLPEDPLGSNPITTNFSSVNFLGYVGTGQTFPDYSEGILMYGLDTGVYVHSGLAPNASNGGDHGEDDWLKGYAAAAIAIEEARRIISQPTEANDSQGGRYSAGFTMQMYPGNFELGSWYGWNIACMAYFRIVIWGSFPLASATNGTRAIYTIPTLELTGSKGQNETFFVPAYPDSTMWGQNFTVAGGTLYPDSSGAWSATTVLSVLFPWKGSYSSSLLMSPSPKWIDSQNLTIYVRASLLFRFDYFSGSIRVLTLYDTMQFVGNFTFTLFA